MFEKNLWVAFLLDFYGEILNERKKNILDMYYNEDLSLAEIATEIGFNTVSFFISEYKKRFGATPSEHRKSLTNS